MIASQVIVDRILATTDYTNVDLLTEFAQDLFENDELPCIRVGYKGVDVINPYRNLSLGEYRTHNEDLIQSFVIQIVSEVEDYHEVWENIFGVDKSTDTIKLLGWNPTSIEENSTPINFIKEDVIGLSQGKQKSQTIIAVGWPTYSY
jgi:hypothetical protein